MGPLWEHSLQGLLYLDSLELGDTDVIVEQQTGLQPQQLHVHWQLCPEIGPGDRHPALAILLRPLGPGSSQHLHQHTHLGRMHNLLYGSCCPTAPRAGQ